jgi:hypothetical protein
LNHSADNFFLEIMDAKVPACLKNNSQKGYILKRITVVTFCYFEHC